MVVFNVMPLSITVSSYSLRPCLHVGFQSLTVPVGVVSLCLCFSVSPFALLSTRSRYPSPSGSYVPTGATDGGPGTGLRAPSRDPFRGLVSVSPSGTVSGTLDPLRSHSQRNHLLTLLFRTPVVTPFRYLPLLSTRGCPGPVL